MTPQKLDPEKIKCLKTMPEVREFVIAKTVLFGMRR